MARAFKSRILVEKMFSGNQWKLLREGFTTVKAAEEWIADSIEDADILRIVRVSGVFEKKTIITKR